MNIKKSLKQGLITGIKSTLGTLHCATVYTANAIEETEVLTTQRLTGETRAQIINDRRVSTINTKAKHKELVDSFTKSLKDISKATHERTMDLIVEVQTFNVNKQ